MVIELELCLKRLLKMWPWQVTTVGVGQSLNASSFLLNAFKMASV